MRAYDAAGNAGALTYKLVVVPSVKNLTLAAAKALLVKRGLKLGAVKRIFSAAVVAGRVVSASKSGVLKAGTGVAVSVSLGRANRPGLPPAARGRARPAEPARSATPRHRRQPDELPGHESSVAAAPAGPAPAFLAGSAHHRQRGRRRHHDQLRSDVTNRRLVAAPGLGLALLGGAFILAAGALMRSRQRRYYDEAIAATPAEPVVFWDTRLLQLTTSTVRRLTGRY